MKRALLLMGLGLASLATFGATPAQAATYCAELLGNSSCDQHFTGTATSIQAAVEAAADNPGPDTVLIGPGNFTSPTPMALYGSGTDNQVTIIGSGSLTDPNSNTILSVSDQANPNITFNAGNGSSMSNLSFFIDASSAPGGKEGLTVQNSFEGESPTISNIRIYSNPNPRDLAAVVLYDGSDLADSSVDVQSASYATQAVKANGEGSEVSDSYLAGSFGVVQNVTNGDLTLNRVEVRATSKALTNAGGRLYVNDSLIELSSGNAQVAVDIKGGNTGSGEAMFNGSTIIANAGSGISIEASQGSSNADVHFDNSVLAGTAGTVGINAANAGDTAYFTSDSGAYDSTKLSYSGSGSVFIDPQELVDLSAASPGFVDAPNGNYRLSSGSALIDAGQDAAVSEGALDLQGYPRACHGTDSGVIRRDIGAFEFKTDPEDDCTYPTTFITAVPQSPTVNPTPSFTFATDKNPGTYLCSWNGQPEVACAFNAKAPNLGVGLHSLSVRTKDRFGNIDQTPEVASYEVKAAPEPEPEPTCETHPALCPKPPVDRKPPRVTGLKSPKKTKAKRVRVRFKSNEKGVTFTCKLNRAKAKRCKSPWRTPTLRKGKNTIQIQATDKAGNRSKVVKRVIRRR